MKNLRNTLYFTLFAASLFSAPNALAGEITVVVRDAATLAPVVNTDVQIYQGNFNVQREDTDENGRVTFTLDPGQYDVTTFRPEGYVREWQGGIVSQNGARNDGAELIDVTATSSETVFLDLGPESVIRGRIIASDGNPNMGGYSILSDGSISGFTRGDGTFEISNAPAGTYHLRTNRSSSNVAYLHEWYGGELVSPYNNADPIADGSVAVTIGEGEVLEGIDFELDLGGVVEIILKAGTSNVTDVGVETTLVIQDGPSGSQQYRARPDPVTGIVRLEGLFPGTYEVGVNTFNFFGWLDANTTLEVPAGVGVTELEIPLEQAGTISGQVVDGDGNPLEEFNVSARGTNGVGGTFTDENGHYQIDVPPGTGYHIKAGRVSETFQTEWYDDIPASPLSNVPPEGSTPIDAAAGQLVTGIDFVLEPTTILEGTVRSEEGVPLSGITVSVYREDGRRMATASTDNRGEYTVTYLATGTYYVRAEGGDNYASEWSTDAAVSSVTLPARPDPVADGAQAVVMPPGETTTVDFALTPQARLVGRIADKNDAPVANANLTLHSVAGNIVATTTSGADGSYAFDGLSVGTHFLRAETASASTWFGQVISTSADPTANVAAPIELRRGATTADIWMRSSALPSSLGELDFGTFGAGVIGMIWPATLGERYEVQWSLAVDGTWSAAPDGDAPEMKSLRIASATGTLLYTCVMDGPERYFRIVTLR